MKVQLNRRRLTRGPLRGRFWSIGWTCRPSLLAALGVAALFAFSEGTYATSAAAAGGSGDFNGDGVADLAIGAPLVDVDGIINAGAVKELHGGPNGLTASGRMWHQNKLRGVAEPGDRFGSALAAGDFNSDGFDDLAIGVPYEDLPGFPPVGGKVNAGAVNVVYGSETGLRAAGNSFWHQDRPSVERAEPGDRFGSALAAGDFADVAANAADDLAIGVPYEDLGFPPNRKVDAGAFNVLYGYEDEADGSLGGLGAHGPFSRAFWHQDVPQIESIARAGDRFGSALAAANFGFTNHEDLAIGVPRENARGVPNAGAVNVLYGSSTQLTVTDDQLWDRAIGGVNRGDHFGSALAAANLGDSGEADLAIGAPYADVDDAANAGSVNVLYGSTSDGLTVNDDDPLWHQNVGTTTPEAWGVGVVRGVPGEGDRFGSELAAADHVLAIGVPFEDDFPHPEGTADVIDAGAVNVIYSSTAGLHADSPTNDQLWHRRADGVELSASVGDRFGSALSVSRVADDSTDIQLAIGAPFLDLGGKDDAGAVNVLYGSDPTTGGLVAAGNQEFDRNTPGIEGAPKPHDRFGRALR